MTEQNEPNIRVVDAAPRAQIPRNVQVDESVDLHCDDPALLKGRRVCIAKTRRGARCGASALRDVLLCNAHAGGLDSRAGGRARAERIRRQRDAAEERAVLSRMGTRATIAAVLTNRHDAVAAAVNLLLDDASDKSSPTRLKSAQLLLPYVDQALGKPTERVEHPTPSSFEELEQMDTEQLEALVARGRQRRLALVRENQERDPEVEPTSTSMLLPMPEGG
jgi:hypothetical protein